jgi:hypothetical protein
MIRGIEEAYFCQYRDQSPERYLDLIRRSRLVAVLLARHKELAGQVTPGLRGMPLGLPALSAEQIQLVESWIAQGRPQ